MTATAILPPVASKTCAKCGCTRFSKDNKCLDCVSKRRAIYRANNPNARKASDLAYKINNAENILLLKKEWNAKNKEKINAKLRERRAANPLKYREISKASYIRNKEKANRRTSEYYKKNTDRIKVVVKIYRSENREKINAKMKVVTQNRRAKKRENGGTLSKGIVEKLIALQKGKCPCCGKALGDNYHMDHIIPIALGGLNTDENIQLLRQRCNNQKHAKHPIDFMQSRGFLL